MTNKEAIEIFEKYLKCAEETCCIMDCFNCGYDIDDNQIYGAIEVAIKALKTTGEDLILRQDAIDALSHMCSEDENGITVSRANVNSMLRALPSSQPEQRWIPCSERLPEVGKEVLVCYDFKCHRSVYIANFYGDGEFHGYDDEYLTPEGRKYRKAVAWMELPEPYREKSKK